MAETKLEKTQEFVDERSLGDLFTELANESSALMRQEVALAQAEITQKATKVGINVGYLVVGGSIAFIAVQSIVAAVIIALGVLIGSYWISALIVGIIVAIVAYFMVSSALESLKKLELTPEQTVETLKEDAEWVKEQVS
ncbi:MAG: phage holin family protein [Aridibacter sp.]|jgi:predicted phage tail protein